VILISASTYSAEKWWQNIKTGEESQGNIPVACWNYERFRRTDTCL